MNYSFLKTFQKYLMHNDYSILHCEVKLSSNEDFACFDNKDSS